MSKTDDEAIPFPVSDEELEALMQLNFGMSRAEYGALSFEERVALMLSSGRPYACTANVAPLDQDGNPVTEGGETSPTRH